MYVCVCHAVTEQDVADAIDEGAETVAGVGAACQAGRDCGACHETIEGMLRERCPRRRLAVIGGRAA
jgi:bacterioferritin-associated ferredoxin